MRGMTPSTSPPCRVPGVLSARRYRTSGGNPKYAALYHLASRGGRHTGVERASESTPMPQQVRDQISNRLRLVCRIRARVGSSDHREGAISRVESARHSSLRIRVPVRRDRSWRLNRSARNGFEGQGAHNRSRRNRRRLRTV